MARADAAGRRRSPSEADCTEEPDTGGGFEFPSPPDGIPGWADREAAEWRGLDRFSMEIKAEEHSGMTVEIREASLPESIWGFHIARAGRARLCVNSELPGIWKRFALYHELYHLISHSMGEHFWRHTYHSISKFESEADLFAWAAIWPEWTEGE